MNRTISTAVGYTFFFIGNNNSSYQYWDEAKERYKNKTLNHGN
jgi:hypothetical protein